MNGLDNYYRAQLAQHQASIDANQEPEPYTPTHQEQAFIKAYRLCMGNAPQHELEYFVQYKDKAQQGDFREQQLVREGAEYWNGIEDAWLLWHEAIEYAKGAA